MRNYTFQTSKFGFYVRKIINEGHEGRYQPNLYEIRTNLQDIKKKNKTSYTYAFLITYRSSYK